MGMDIVISLLGQKHFINTGRLLYFMVQVVVYQQLQPGQQREDHRKNLVIVYQPPVMLTAMDIVILLLADTMMPEQ